MTCLYLENWQGWRISSSYKTNYTASLVMYKETLSSCSQRTEKTDDEALGLNIGGIWLLSQPQKVCCAKVRSLVEKERDHEIWHLDILVNVTENILSLDFPKPPWPNQVAHSTLLRLVPIPVWRHTKASALQDKCPLWDKAHFPSRLLEKLLGQVTTWPG